MSIVSTDPIADMLTRIRNAIKISKNNVNLPHSVFKKQLASVLKQQGYIDDFIVEDVAGFKRLVLVINQPGVNPKINEIRRISKPGRRLYSKVDKIPRCMSGRGIVVVSTSQGMMTDSEARKLKVGGELICEVY